MKHYRAVPKISELNKVSKPPNENSKNYKVKALPKAKKYPRVPESFSRSTKDNSVYYKYISTLYEPQKIECLDLRILEMEEWTLALLDGDDGGLTPP